MLPHDVAFLADVLLTIPARKSKCGFPIRPVLYLPHGSFFIEVNARCEFKNEKGSVLVFLIFVNEIHINNALSLKHAKALFINE